MASGVPGECVSTSACSSSGGSSTAGLCPGASDIQCCTYPTCSGGGRCGPETVCTGTTVSGICPGPSSIKCCQGQRGQLSGYDYIQSARLRQITDAVRSRGLSPARQACLAAVATALVESYSGYNYANPTVSSSYNYPYDREASDAGE